jgi:ADP-heptose:LPS heptosyltransferase
MTLPPLPHPRHVVAIRPGALGDTLLALPVLAWLRRQWPATRICLVARGDVLPLARASGLADTVSEFDLPQWADLFADTLPTRSPLRHMLAGSAALAWLPARAGAVARTLSEGGAHPVAIGAGRSAPDAGEHAAVLLGRALAGLGIAPPSLTELVATLPPLRPTREGTARAEVLWRSLGLAQAHGPLVALHPGSGGAAKCWPSSSFAKLAAALHRAGTTPLLIEGPADGAAVEAVMRALPPDAPALPVARDLALGTLAALLARCTAFAGNDSGVTHLAAMLGMPTLALFGPTDPAVWAPLGPHVRVLRSRSTAIAELPVDEAYRAVAAWLR